MSGSLRRRLDREAGARSGQEKQEVARQSKMAKLVAFLTSFADSSKLTGSTKGERRSRLAPLLIPKAEAKRQRKKMRNLKPDTP
jgi:hypothetical protein